MVFYVHFCVCVSGALLYRTAIDSVHFRKETLSSSAKLTEAWEHLYYLPPRQLRPWPHTPMVGSGLIFSERSLSCPSPPWPLWWAKKVLQQHSQCMIRGVVRAHFFWAIAQMPLTLPMTAASPGSPSPAPCNTPLSKSVGTTNRLMQKRCNRHPHVVYRFFSASVTRSNTLPRRVTAPKVHSSEKMTLNL